MRFKLSEYHRSSRFVIEMRSQKVQFVEIVAGIREPASLGASTGEHRQQSSHEGTIFTNKYATSIKRMVSALSERATTSSLSTYAFLYDHIILSESWRTSHKDSTPSVSRRMHSSCGLSSRPGPQTPRSLVGNWCWQNGKDRNPFLL